MIFFEDIVVGDSVVLGRHTFTTENIKAFAHRYDPQRFHVDEAAAEASHFGALCASGWQTARDEIRRFTGSQFDPTVVAAFDGISDEQFTQLREATL